MIAVGALIPRRGLLGDVHMMAEHGICENGGIGTPESIEAGSVRRKHGKLR
jgi:hypothetical protein